MKRETQQKRKTAKISHTDLFTAMCLADLGVECLKEYLFHPKRKWRFDYAIPQHRIALEVEGGVWSGGRHTSSKGFIGDMEKYNAGTLLGWRIFRCMPETLYSKETFAMIREAVNYNFLP